jgi:2-polyprenyl-6-methoxyphenol hydroxylase-like FAD-dependent oxidoreductase
MDARDGDAGRWSTRCCVVGGGPAGMMLGFLLARAGVEVTVLEKHGDFLRDFRGDTIHPSTLELMYELGLLDTFLERPHTKLAQLGMVVDGVTARPVDFSRLPTACRFIAIMPQWDFLSFLAERAAGYPKFRLEMGTEAVELLREGDRVCGVRARTADGREAEIFADLTVAADGRHSVLRRDAGLRSRDWGVPIDVLWFRLPKDQTPEDARDDGADQDPDSLGTRPALGHVSGNRLVITIDRGDYWQVGVVIPKGEFDRVRTRGIQAFRDGVVEVVPFLAGSISGVDDFAQISLLSVQVDHLVRWHRAGLLCIGDAAHAMSPAFGVGVNYAVQDAVATANALAGRLQYGMVTENDLHRIQRRREPPVLAMQAIQVALHRFLLSSPRTRVSPASVPDRLRTISGPLAPFGRRGMGRLVGLGFLPEHIRTSDVHARSGSTTRRAAGMVRDEEGW